MKFPNDAELKVIKDKYPVGTKLRLISMSDIQAPPVGTIGEVTYVDDAGTVHIRWQNGSSLAIIPGIDAFEILS